MAQGLQSLRDRSCLAFLLLNGLFVLVVFVLQANKNCIHVEWPFGPVVNQTFVPCTIQEQAQLLASNADQATQPIMVLGRLKLEPVGLVFLIFFFSLLVIQV